ncbi:MAG: polyprenyl synthetase family protein [Oscillospiraceae bacterium]|nr:polyprenyl synthetase family protein [Oscillospiraceae bacterium]
MTYEERYGEYQEAIETYLDGLFTAQKPYSQLYEAIRYSILGGGKRIRPVLTLEFARLGGINWRLALPFACALELVHNYSLIHDDLPCMDDDDLRRGKPTTHKAYGETLAILAGDALQPEAFRLILEAPALSGERKLDAMRVLVNACGADGMVAGQVLDTLCPIENTEQLRHMEELKTGCMIAAAAELGCAASGMNAGMRNLAVQYAKDLGLAFQIRDDMLDVEGDAAVFGKPIGSDKEEGKFTFVDALGIEGCRAEVARLTEEAKSVVRHWADSDFLVTLSDKLAGRVH